MDGVPDASENSVEAEENFDSLENDANETTEEEIPETVEKVRVFITNDNRNIKEVELDVLAFLQQNNIIVTDQETVLNFFFRKSFLFSIEAYNSEQIFSINDKLIEENSKISIQIECPR